MRLTASRLTASRLTARRSPGKFLILITLDFLRPGRHPSHPLLAALGEHKGAACILRDCPRLVGEFILRSSDV